MATRLETTTIEQDAELTQARAAQHAAQEALDGLLREHRRLTPAVGAQIVPDLARLEREAGIRRAEATREATARQAEAAEAGARARILAADRPAEETRLRRLVEAADAAYREALAYQHDREVLAARVGLVAGRHPLPMLLGLAEPLERVRQELAGEPRPVSAPVVPAVRAGEARMRFTAMVRDLYNQRVQYPNDTAVLPKKVAEDLVERGLGEVI